MVLWVQARLQQEYDRCIAYLDASSRKPLLAAAEQQLVGQHLPVLLTKGFGGLLDAHRWGQLLGCPLDRRGWEAGGSLDADAA